MHLARLQLNPQNADARRDLNSPYDMHRTLQRAFPGGEPDANRLLFRIEPSRPHDTGRTVLVQSSDTPLDLSFLDDAPFAASRPYCLERQPPKEIHPTLRAGQQLAFRLLGNPTKKREGRRIALTDEDDYYDWLARKSDLHGFDVLYAHPTPFWINGDSGAQDTYRKGTIPHFAVRYDGLLRVADPEAVVDTLASGIGPAKAFGFGLLTLAPPRM